MKLYYTLASMASWFLWSVLLCSQDIFDMDDEEDINAIVRKVLSKGERKLQRILYRHTLSDNVLS